MTLSIRSSILLGVLALVLVGCSALAGTLPTGPQPAVAAEGEETTTEEPPVVETPTEPETTPEPETPVTTPPVTTPPVVAPSGGESGSTPDETPKSTPSTGSEASGGGGGGGGSSSGSAGSGSSGGATTNSPTTAPKRHPARVPTHTASNGGGGGGGGGSTTGGGGNGGGGSKVATGGGGGNTGGGGHHAPSNSGGGPAPQPTVSTQGIDEGASAVSNVASHVGQVFAEALPTAPLKKIGDRLAAHIADAGPAQNGKGEKAAADGIGKALGAALIGSAVAVERKPVASTSPIPFFTPPGGKSSTIYLILIAALLLAVGALVYREVRKSLGFDAPRTGVRVADEKPRIAVKERLGVALAGVNEVTHHWFSRFRRLRSSAVAGLRSLF